MSITVFTFINATLLTQVPSVKPIYFQWLRRNSFTNIYLYRPEMGLPVPPSDGPDHLALRLSKYQICVRPPPPTTCLAEPRRPPARSVPVTEVSDFARR